MNPGGPKKLTRLMDGVLARFDYSGLQVLVVEPDAERRAALVRALLQLGLHRPTEAGSGAEAVADLTSGETGKGVVFRLDHLGSRVIDKINVHSYHNSKEHH